MSFPLVGNLFLKDCGQAAMTEIIRRMWFSYGLIIVNVLSSVTLSLRAIAKQSHI